MHGRREEFTYFQSLDCGCLQIGPIPEDVPPHQSNNHFSLAAIQSQPQGDWNRTANQLRTRHALAPKPGWICILRSLTRAAVRAVFLHGLHRRGFTNLTGIAPYIAQDSTPLPSLRIGKLEANQLTGSYDLIVMNHSCEHMAAPLEVPATLRRCLSAEGRGDQACFVLR